MKRQYLIASGLVVIILCLVGAIGFVQQSKYIEDRVPAAAINGTTTGIKTGAATRTINVDNKKRTYTTYIPSKSIIGTADINVLFVFHGTNQSGTYIRDITGFNPVADSRGFVVVYPEALKRNGSMQWDPTNGSGTAPVKDIDFIRSVIKQLEVILQGRVGKIYAAGFSNGSVMTQTVGCSINEVKGIAPVAAGMGDTMLARCTLTRKIPYIGFDGTILNNKVYEKSELVKYEASVSHFALQNECSTATTTTKIPDNGKDGTATVVTLNTYRQIWDKPAACVPAMNYYRIEGGGHLWPGSTAYTSADLKQQDGKLTKDINATILIADFFKL